MILVVGATGQVGYLTVRALREQGHDVRALVRRPGPAANDVARTGAELTLGDLRDPASLDRAVRGVRAVVATATVLAPTQPGDTHEAVERRGYDALIEQAAHAGVDRFVFTSVPLTPLDDEVPQLAAKRHIERRLAAAPMSTLVLRLSLYTEVWLALVGSEVPLRGEMHATLNRPYGFLRAFRRASGRTVERFGRLVVPGPPTNRHAFISVHDVASLLAAAAATEHVSGTVDVGGPEVLSWTDVAAIYSDVLRRPVDVVSLPAGPFGVAQRMLTPVAPAAANIMGMNRAVAAMQTEWDTAAVTGSLGLRRLRTVRQILTEKASLAA